MKTTRKILSIYMVVELSRRFYRGFGTLYMYYTYLSISILDCAYNELDIFPHTSSPPISCELAVSFPLYCTCTFKLKREDAEVSINLPLSCTTSQASFDEEEVREKVEGSCNFATLPDASQKPPSTMSIPLRVRPTKECYEYASHPFHTQSIRILLHLLLLQDPNRYDTPSPSPARIKVPSTYLHWPTLLASTWLTSQSFFSLSPPIIPISLFRKQAIQHIPNPHLSSCKIHHCSLNGVHSAPHLQCILCTVYITSL